VRATNIAKWPDIPDRSPVGSFVEGIDLVIVRDGSNHSVLYGRCLHRGALMADGFVRCSDLICGLHGWDYGIHTGISAYNNDERLPKFASWLEGDKLVVGADEIAAWAADNPQPYNRDS